MHQSLHMPYGWAHALTYTQAYTTNKYLKIWRPCLGSVEKHVVKLTMSVLSYFTFNLLFFKFYLLSLMPARFFIIRWM